MSELPEHDLKVIGAFVDDALALGHTVSVNDGEEWTVKLSTDRAAIMDALGTTDSDLLRIRRMGVDTPDPKSGKIKRAAGELIGTAHLVYGNEPGVVISDHTDTPEMHAILKRADEIGQRLYNAAA